MTHNRLFVLATVGLLIGTAGGPSAADVRHERTERKPSIVEIGEPHSISMATLQREAGKISDLRDFIIRNGYPDYAEVQEVAPAWPWESYEVRVYYMQWNIEVDFGHVLFSDALADLGVEKFWGDITPEKRHEIEVILQARQAPPPAPPVRTGSCRAGNAGTTPVVLPPRAGGTARRGAGPRVGSRRRCC
jgi:hypothetical protein